MKNKTFYSVIYPFVLLASAFCFIGPIGAILYTVFTLLDGKEINPIIVGVGIAVAILNKPLWDLRIACRNTTEYDEFGMSKKFQSYERMSAKDKAEIDKQKLQDMERVMNSSAIKKMTHPGSSNPEKDMNKLVGLSETKNYMREMAARMEFERKNKVKANVSSKHMVFAGNPGTGKTTVARIMAGFLYKYGYIKKNKCVEVNGNDLRSNNPGDTTLKTELIIRQAVDGVLFIDEAYSLMSANGATGQEAIATLIKEMEDKRDRFILILAGYTNEMQQLIKTNPGFQSRIKEYVMFPDYTLSELKDIFQHMANDNNFCVNADALDVFEQRITKEKKLSSFGNARTVRNILDKAINKHTLNLKDKIIPMDDKFKICKEDINPNLENTKFVY